MPLPRSSSPAPRRHPVPLLVRLGTLPVGRTRNLSLNGAFVETTARPPVGSCAELSIVWGAVTAWCTVRVVRHAADGVGLTFVDADALFTQAVAEIVAEAARPRAALQRA